MSEVDIRTFCMWLQQNFDVLADEINAEADSSLVEEEQAGRHMPGMEKASGHSAK